jgi:excinuclease ABC subunit B
VAGQVILYADIVTGSMRACLDETDRRRKLQRRYNEEHGITPESIRKAVSDVLTSIYEADYVTVPIDQEKAARLAGGEDAEAAIHRLRGEMKAAAERLEFEKAARLRDEIRDLTSFLMEMGEGPAAGGSEE